MKLNIEDKNKFGRLYFCSRIFINDFASLAAWGSINFPLIMSRDSMEQQTEWTCKNCGKVNESDFGVCPECSTERSCRQCGVTEATAEAGVYRVEEDLCRLCNIEVEIK